MHSKMNGKIQVERIMMDFGKRKIPVYYVHNRENIYVAGMDLASFSNHPNNVTRFLKEVGTHIGYGFFNELHNWCVDHKFADKTHRFYISLADLSRLKGDKAIFAKHSDFSLFLTNGEWLKCKMIKEKEPVPIKLKFKNNDSKRKPYEYEFAMRNNVPFGKTTARVYFSRKLGEDNIDAWISIDGIMSQTVIRQAGYSYKSLYRLSLRLEKYIPLYHFPELRDWSKLYGIIPNKYGYCKVADLFNSNVSETFNDRHIFIDLKSEIDGIMVSDIFSIPFIEKSNKILIRKAREKQIDYTNQLTIQPQHSRKKKPKKRKASHLDERFILGKKLKRSPLLDKKNPLITHLTLEEQIDNDPFRMAVEAVVLDDKSIREEAVRQLKIKYDSTAKKLIEDKYEREFGEKYRNWEGKLNEREADIRKKEDNLRKEKMSFKKKQITHILRTNPERGRKAPLGLTTDYERNNIRHILDNIM